MIPVMIPMLGEEEAQAAADAVRSGWVAQGPRVARFEQEFAAAVGAGHGVAVSSCTTALHLALVVHEVGPGDEVIVPSITFVATANAVLYCGGTPVFAEIRGQHDPGIDPAHVASLIGPRTKAVAAVHFAGYPAAVDELRALCDRHGLALIEDVAHAPSATLHGRALGTWGLAGAFSFFSNKILSCGEGGLLATDDEEVAALARSLRNHGMTSGTWARQTRETNGYDVVGLGFNYRLDEPRSALLLSRLARLEPEIERRRELTRAYRERLADVPGVLVPNDDASVARSSCYVMPILVEDDGRRDAVRARLRDTHGIQTSVFYPALHEFTEYRRRFGAQSLPHTERVARTEITIPLFAHLDTRTQDRVVSALQEALA
jgi:dTDP-4-amino-4,6-dideoxygalactose transaminase